MSTPHPETPPETAIASGRNHSEMAETAPQVLPAAALTLEQMRRYAWWALGVIVAFGLLFWLLGPIMTPFVLGGVIAYVGHPLVARLERKKVPRALGAVVVILLGLAAIVGLVFIVIPLAQAEIAQLANRIPALLAKAQEVWLPALNAKYGISVNLDVSQIRSWLTENLSDVGAIAAKVAKSLHVGGLAVLGFLATALLTPLVTFYLLKDWPQLTRSLTDLIPRGLLPSVQSFAQEINTVIAEFLRGQFAVMAALAVFYAVGLKIVGLEHGIAIGILTGLLVFIPYIGFGLGLILAIVAALTQFATLGPLVGVAIVYGLGQVIEGFYLTPRLVGERVGLHPLAVLFALMAFGQLFGFVGVLVAVPASAILLVALRNVRKAYIGSEVYNNEA
jgi:predicted PurR-regulated permease PerM